MMAAWVAVMVFVAVVGLVWGDGFRAGGALNRLDPLTRRPRLDRLCRWWGMLRAWRDRRLREAGLGQVAAMLAGGVAAGMSIPVALEQAAHQVSGPLKRDLEAVLSEYRLGISLSGALRSWKARARSPDVDFLVEALELIRQVGGSTSQPLVHAAAALENRRRDREEAWAHLAEARLSAGIVAAMPPLMVFLLARAQDESWRVLWATAPGHLALAFAAVCWLTGVTATAILLRPPR